MQRQRRAFHGEYREAMMTAGLILFGVTTAIVVFGLRRRSHAKPSDLGAVSEAWLAEESAAGPRRY